MNDVYPLAAEAYICIKLHSARYPHLAHFILQIPSSWPAPSPTFSRLSLLFLAGASLIALRLCIRLRQCMKLWPKNIATWSQSTTSW